MTYEDAIVEAIGQVLDEWAGALPPGAIGQRAGLLCGPESAPQWATCWR